ncbi:hypothetical protein D9757_004916 [Collybiopsis confluens]|uniref:Origin recognition complex subunit 4 n=1 Tax=Collybiopsis confluens TaxID=2823264 RepID=A0A8H5HT18_9AGAR|nr:hypothetical protein D9757_004916 [Collybiopsis confluens]
MAPKRKASSTPLDESPSKRITRSNSNLAFVSISTPSPNVSSDDESRDELDLFDESLPTPSRNSKKSERRSRLQPEKSVTFVDILPEPLPSPPKGTRESGKQSPQKRIIRKNNQLKSPSLTPPPPVSSPTIQPLPSRCASKTDGLHDSLHFQKRAILWALQFPPLYLSLDDDAQTTNESAVQVLGSLLDGTVSRGEGNSCLLLGPRASGKTRLLESCIAGLSPAPIAIRLSGWVQTNDRLAMRELSRQLSSQVSSTLLPEELRSAVDEASCDVDENPFLDTTPEAIELSVPTAHMHSLIACIPTLGRPTVVILDAFDLFAEHPRQSLLYSLLDTVQSCRAGGNGKGLAVVGVTARMDSNMMLEKRVKSRFSGRMIRTSASSTASRWKDMLRTMLTPQVDEVTEDFSQSWKSSVDEFLADAKTTRILEEVCSVIGEFRSLARFLISPVLNLNSSHPRLTASQLEISIETQYIRTEYSYLHTLNYPSLCLLLAFYQAESDGYPALTFEMLNDYVRNAIRVSGVAPVQVNGGNIGMTRCTRPVLWTAFEQLIAAQIFVALTAPSQNLGKNFLKYRCAVTREDVRKSVEKTGNSSLKLFLRRALVSH